MTRISPSAKVTVKVTDEFGNPLVGAKVETITFDHYAPAAEWGGYEAIYKSVTFLTDKQGIAVVEVKLPHEESGPHEETGFRCSVNFPGYYSDWGECKFTGSLMGLWQPWNQEVDVVPQKIGVQAPMYAGWITLKQFPEVNKPLGFDLMVGDWVAPYGKGNTSDFIYDLEIAQPTWITNSFRNTPEFLRDWKLVVTFPNDGDGIQPFVALPHGLRSPRQAPIGGFEPTLVQHEYQEPYEEVTKYGGQERRQTHVRLHQGFQPDRNYFFRVRTKKDENGNIISALYGKVYGDFRVEADINGRGIVGARNELNFIYYLTPVLLKILVNIDDYQHWVRRRWVRVDQVPVKWAFSRRA